MRLDSFSNLVSELDAIVAWSNVTNLIFEPYGRDGRGLHFALQPGSWGYFLHMHLRVGADPLCRLIYAYIYIELCTSSRQLRVGAGRFAFKRWLQALLCKPSKAPTHTLGGALVQLMGMPL